MSWEYMGASASPLFRYLGLLDSGISWPEGSAELRRARSVFLHSKLINYFGLAFQISTDLNFFSSFPLCYELRTMLNVPPPPPEFQYHENFRKVERTERERETTDGLLRREEDFSGRSLTHM